MQFTHLAMALFAAVALGAPAAAPSDIFESPATESDAGSITIGVPPGEIVPIPQACCVLRKKGKSGGTYIGCGGACDHVYTHW